jgi:GTP-binding protein
MYLDDRAAVIADIPGLIEGASAGAGLGFRFLRHIARTRAIAYVVDLADQNPCETLEMLRHELAAYGHGLESRPYIIIGNKTDLPGADDHAEALRSCSAGVELIRVSALQGDGIRELAGALISIGETA